MKDHPFSQFLICGSIFVFDQQEILYHFIVPRTAQKNKS